MFYTLIGAAGLLAAAATTVATVDVQPAPPPDHAESAAEQRLEQTVRAAIMTDGPFFNAEERAVVERACGMAPGSWDGTDVSMDDDHFRCSNGREAVDPRLVAMIQRAAPRIAARVQAAMARPEVQAAIDAVARDATEQALREVHEELGRAARRRD